MSSPRLYWLYENHIFSKNSAMHKLIESMIEKYDDSDLAQQFLTEMMLLEKKAKAKKKSKKKAPKVIIKTEHPGILEVPRGKEVDELPLSHFERLVDKHGFEKISKALTNLEVWNKNRNPRLANWARETERKLHKKYRPDEKQGFMFDF
jgi:hypothetical protein